MKKFKPMKNGFIKITLLIVIIFAVVWACDNIDFTSVFSDSQEAVKHEFASERFQKSFEGLQKTLKQHL